MEENIKKRFDLLNAIYAASGGDPSQRVDLRTIATELGFQGQDLRNAYLYLSAEGLIHGAMNGMSTARISHEGIKELEQKLANPTLPTQHFTFNGNISGNFSNVVGSNNTVNQTATIDITNALAEFEEELRQLDGGVLSSQSQQLVDSIKSDDPVTTMNAAAELTKAGNGRIEKIKDFVTKAASSATGGAAVLALKAFLASHGIVL